MSIIDFGARPNTAASAEYLAWRLADIRAMGLQSPTGDDWYEGPTETIEQFVARLDRAGIAATVCVGRYRGDAAGWLRTARDVARLMASYPDRILGFAGLDATRLEAAEAEIRYAVEDLGLLGVDLDPFQIDLPADHACFDVVYRTCESLSIPLMLTFGAMPGINANLHCGPLAVDRIAQRYPELTLIACHGAWPFLTEMIAVAWRNPNVYFDNSFYHFAPGAQVIVDAANNLIGDKVIYASAYPFCPLEETLERFSRLGFTDTVRRKVLYGNAARVLGLIEAPE